MLNFQFNNVTDSIAKIDIIGDIGESFFSDGVTINDVLFQLNNIKSKEIQLNVNSLGGDVNHALAIHDAIKMHPAKVTAKITGMTASSGTIIAMSADVVEMSQNAFFLIHNVWTGLQGNQHELREMADELEKMDDILASLYAKKTGKRKSQMLTLMAEERWLNADEAKEFGFIDNKFEPMAIAASVMDSINNSKELPNINLKNNKMKEQIEELKSFISDLFNNKKDEVEGIEKVKPELIVEFENKIKELEVSKSEEIATKENDFNAKLEELNNAIENEKAEIEKVKAEKIELENKINELNAELELKNADSSDLKGGDPVPAIDAIEPTKLEKELRSLASSYKNRVITEKKN